MEKENIDPKLVLALMEREICRRALLMHLLMLGYEHFVSIDMLKRSMKTRKFTYEEAERLADTLERHMGIKVAPEKFIRDENEDANKTADTQVAEKASLNKAQAGAAVDAVFATITEALKAGDEVRIVGFGNFVVTERAASEGRNPQTGEPLKIAASKQPKFSAGSKLKASPCNQLPTS